MCDAHKTCMSCPLRPLKDNASFFACSDGAQDGFDMIVEGLAAIAATYPEHVRVQRTVAD